MLSVLTVTSLFPNPIQPVHGIFVETRLTKLLETGQIEAEVIAPIPWLPRGLAWLHSDRLDLIPQVRQQGKVRVHHPRYLAVPKLGMHLTPYTMFLTLKRSLGNLLARGRRFDLIDAHYFYPDGVAAIWLGRHFNIPVCVTSRGTDLNLIPNYATPRRLICEAAIDADGLITVCQALKERLVELGSDSARIEVLRNGVDLEQFRPIDRSQARIALGCDRRTLGTVGLLIPRKGHHHCIRALVELPNTDLLVIGEGPQRSFLEHLASQLGVSNRVRFLGRLDKPQLMLAYNAMDALVLASSREGWANVLLEAMACGTPVVASPVWGTPEVVTEPEAGILMSTIDEHAVADSVNELFSSYPDRSKTRRYAERFSWESTTEGQLRLFNAIVERRRSNKAA